MLGGGEKPPPLPRQRFRTAFSASNNFVLLLSNLCKENFWGRGGGGEEKEKPSGILGLRFATAEEEKGEKRVCEAIRRKAW